MRTLKPRPLNAREQAELYERFKTLHEKPGIFIMPNAWDAISAALLAQAGFETFALLQICGASHL